MYFSDKLIAVKDRRPIEVTGAYSLFRHSTDGILSKSWPVISIVIGAQVLTYREVRCPTEGKSVDSMRLAEVQCASDRATASQLGGGVRLSLFLARCAMRMAYNVPDVMTPSSAVIGSF